MAKTIVAKGGRELWGRLEEESLLELIEPVCQSGSSVALTIRLGGETGRFYFKKGRLVHADTKSIRGKESAYELISWRNGVFRLVKDREPEVETVDIAWEEFKERYREELGKIVLALVPKVERGFCLELVNIKGQAVFSFLRLDLAKGEELMRQWFRGEQIEQAKAQMRKGNISMFQDVRQDKEGNYFLLLVYYLREMRCFIHALFPETGESEEHVRWITQTFEPRALDAVSIALQRADKTDVRGTILVIDDSPSVRELLADMLADNGFRAFTAEDGFEGLVKVQDVRPDLIILDVLMPRMDGYEVCRRLKRDDRTKHIPVIMLSQKELGEDRGEGFQQGADMYIEKPFTEKKIITIVESVLGIG